MSRPDRKEFGLEGFTVWTDLCTYPPPIGALPLQPGVLPVLFLNSSMLPVYVPSARTLIDGAILRSGWIRSSDSDPNYLPFTFTLATSPSLYPLLDPDADEFLPEDATPLASITITEGGSAVELVFDVEGAVLEENEYLYLFIKTGLGEDGVDELTDEGSSSSSSSSEEDDGIYLGGSENIDDLPFLPLPVQILRDRGIAGLFPWAVGLTLELRLRNERSHP